LADASSLGVPTIEYTNYKEDILLRTNYKSINPEFVDHFLNRNKTGLENILKKIFSRNLKKTDINLDKISIDEDKSKLFLNLQ